MGKKTLKTRLYPTEDEPRYGQQFRVTGAQFIDLDGKYTNVVSFEIMSSKNQNQPHYFKVGKNWTEWKFNRDKIRDQILKILDTNHEKGLIPYREVSAIKGKYFGEDEELIL